MKKTIFMYFIIFAALLSSFTIVSAKDIDSVLDDKVNETWISISGTAIDLKPAQFTLDYGKGKMTVEMEGWKWYAKNYKEMAGDKLTVSGRLGESLFQGRIINPTSIYDEKLGTYFYGKSGDEAKEYRREYMQDPVFEFWAKSRPVVVGGVTVQGTVTGVNGRLFTVDTGKKSITVNTSSMPYDPLDKKGYKAISKGEYVNITGYLSEAITKKGELIADHIVIIKKD